MPRSRGTEMPQRPSPLGPHPLRTTSSDSDQRPTTDRCSPKLGERQSPRADSLNQKKLGTRIADLESQLGQAQEELKNLKKQLTLAEAAKREAQQELEKKKKKPVVTKTKRVVKKNPMKEIEASKSETSDTADENSKETDVFEVPVEKEEVDSGRSITEAEKESNLTEVSAEAVAILEQEPRSLEEFALKDEEISKLKTNLEETEKKLQVIRVEKENIKNQLDEATSLVTAAKAKEEEMSSRLSQLGEELEASNSNAAMLNEKLKEVEGAKEALEEDMKKMRVQTEQWRKAADAAAAVLAGGMDINGKIPERCGSMDKHFTGMFETPVYTGFIASPGLADDSDDGFGSVKRKGSGRRMFGDLWRKKGQK